MPARLGTLKRMAYKRLLVVVGVITLGCLAVTTTRAASTNNILLIIADDYGTDASPLYNMSQGASVSPTPQIATLAAAGVRFTNAYAYPVCSPTRSCILTGRYGLRTGTGNVFSAAAGNALKASEFTLPDAFAANSDLGYQLKHFGKWHLGGANTAPCANGGWPAFSGTMLGEIPNYTSWTKVVTNGLPAGTSSGTVTTYATATKPAVTAFGTSGTGFTLTVAQNSGASQTLWSCTDLGPGFWAPVSGATSQVSGSSLTFTDNATILNRIFYSVLTETP